MRLLAFGFALLFSLSLFSQSAEEILQQSIRYHDPENEWSNLKATFSFDEERPKSEDRYTIVKMDLASGQMSINRNGEEVYEVTNDSVRIISGNRDKERGQLLRNYYLYLWGLPMKLNDEGTTLDTKAMKEHVNGIECYVLRVPYEKDTWYFYFDVESYRLVQYKFYQDEEETRGELITLEDEVTYGAMKIPSRRTWYTLPNLEYLGTDILSKIE